MALAVVVSRETWVSRHGPPSTISNELQSCVDSSLSFSTVAQICSDALYTPDLAPFCSAFSLVPAFTIPLVGGLSLFYFLFSYTSIRGILFVLIQNEQQKQTIRHGLERRRS